MLQKDNLTPQKEIAEQVNLSTTAVHRRIKRLTALGVIQQNVAIVNPEKVGHTVTLIVEIALNDVHFRMTDEAKKIFLSIPQIQQCYQVTGDADFILIITLQTMAQYTELNRQLFETNPNIKGVKTFVSISQVKTGQELLL
ncbi:AsnC family transcriptional regulator [Dyadobacter luteus]|uniref:AsnC family transcriptional regulator n=1 Tax=Dyadobacter luteus TaxID=2259619 RepID=A0A3D8Y2E9_9BACT|nr:AsnC family transcriptional regulator [Dyadobacter luteus]